MADSNGTNGRITTREFYKKQLETVELIHSVKDDIMHEIQVLSSVPGRVDKLEKDVDKLQSRSNWLDGLTAMLAILAGVIGFNK